MIVTDIKDANVTLVMPAVQAGVLLKFLSEVRKPITSALVSEAMNKIGITVSELNVEAHLEAIRVTLSDHEEDIFPHLGMCFCPDCDPGNDEGSVEVPKKMEIVH